MTSIATHFKKLTTGNNVFNVSVIVEVTVTHIPQFFNQMFNVSTLLWMTPLTNSVITKTLQQFASLIDISQGSEATHEVRWGLQ